MKKKTKRIHLSTISFSLALGAMLGFLCTSITCFSISIGQLTALVFFFCLVNAFIFRRLGRIAFAFCAGFILASIRYEPLINSRTILEQYRGQATDYSLKVSTDPTLKNKTWRFEATNIVIDGRKLESLFYVSLPESYPKPTRGDILYLHSDILNGFGKYDAYISRPNLISSSKPDPPDYSLIARNKFSQIFKAFIGPERINEVALGLGYLTGQKDSMPESLNEKLRRAGLAHVVVASGFHLGLICNLVRKALKKVSRFASFFFAIIVMLAFISITGFSASMLRAGLVTGISLFAGYFGGKFHPVRLLLFAATISLFYNPIFLKDVAWQLSFASFAGLLLFSPLVQDYFFGRESGFIRSTLVATVSAQLFCLPISIYTFGSFSLIGIISNFLIPPTIPLAMLLCFLVVVFSPIVELGQFFAFLARSLLGLHVGVINYLSHFDWASSNFESGNNTIFLLYLAIAVVFFLLKWRTKYDFRPLLVKLRPMEKSQKDVKIYSC